ncbi:ABC transporter permease [Paenibacillus melissococcoides]|uniref:ABC transporter permease n=1 Tax=Paenibacillus melissococcoides TaxID=2912268 RepID=A0ABN8TZQ2_9BACL|nr:MULTISPECIES: ABC transporter permease [Paenibacillus]MEB9895362.1 ABC transporter permease [Bacillus cereus]CAH8244272.1 ABC transporter permease [Paenibacillus melissococcoides]CAH8703533.1 ABC transporter permease [Paenibacillus melissococcoides]CAH8705950.1 ABC transporter permease [Paenibacillus melissococcoides]GIO81533.1 permease [Paenibacillus dendritiformis]
MREMAYVFHLNWLRLMSRKAIVAITAVMTIAAVAAALLLTPANASRGSIAFITAASEPGEATLAGMHEFKVKRLAEVPRKSELVRNKYDAVIIDEGDGSYTIETMKSDAYAAMVRQALEHPEQPLPAAEKRGAGANIAGFLMMFVLLQGMFYMNFFAEDKAQGTLRRIAASPLSVMSYLAVQALFCFLLISVPAYLCIAGASLLLRADIGFTLLQYGWLIAVLSVLAAAFALFITVCIDEIDNAVTTASSLILVTSLLSGGFYTVEHEGAMNALTYWLPQRQYMAAVTSLERGAAYADAVWPLVYVLVLSGILFAAGALICRRRCQAGRY